MLVKTNIIKNKDQQVDSKNSFDPDLLILKRCTILNSSVNTLVLKGTSADSYHADYVIDGLTNKMKILSFSCEFHSTANTGHVDIYAGKNQSESDILYSIDETTDLGKVDLCVPITEDYMKIRFGCHGDYTSLCEVDFSNIHLSISEKPIPVQSKTVSMSNSVQSIVPDRGYLFNEIEVPALICKGVHRYVYADKNHSAIKTSPVFDSGNTNKKGVFVFGQNLSSFVVQGSHDNSTWTNLIEGSNNGSSNHVGTAQAILSSNRSYRYFRCQFSGYENGEWNIVAWGVFDSQ